jgi:plasmid stabilization system protein ParE
MILLSSEAISDIERIRDFLHPKNPHAAVSALRAIWAALARLENFPELGRPTKDPGIRQITIRFGSAAYVVRYTIRAETGAVLVTRIWHSREDRGR